MKNTVEGIKSSLDEVEYQISKTEDKAEKKFPDRATKVKKTQKE